MTEMKKIEAGLGKDIEIIAPIKGNMKQDIENGRQAILQEWKDGKLPEYYSNLIKKIRNYKQGTSRKVDAALYYLSASIGDFSNQIPRRIKVEIGIQNLEGILKNAKFI